MVLTKMYEMKKLKIISVILFILLYSETNGQNHITQIPSKIEIVTIHDWLVSNPIPSHFYENDLKAAKLLNGYAIDFLTSIGGEKSPKITPDENFNAPDGKSYKFFYHSWESKYIDLTELFGRPSDVFVYLYAELESNIEQDVYLHIGTNDAGKVFFNGDLVIDYPTGRTAEPSQNIAKVKLNKGSNSILLKINQFGGGWGAYVQIYSLHEQKKFDTRSENLIANSEKTATILSTKVICKQPDRYIGWPTITKTSTGELVTVFSGNRDAHVCPYGITQLIRSSDNGKTWSQTEIINNTPLDDRDAGIIETKSGDWVVSWFTSMAFDNDRFYANNPGWKRHREKLSQERIDKWIGNWTRRSTDKGKTWDSPVKQLVSAPHGPIQLKDNRLLYVGTANSNGVKSLAVEQSKDNGISWELLSTIDIPNNESIDPYSEPHVVEMPDGKLVALFRYQPSEKSNSFMRQSDSYDGGKTWSETRKINVWGYPPHLLLLDNGWILMSYGVRRIPYGERACISKDGGKTWDIENEILICMSDSEDLGYPSSIQLDDGSIITIYYQIDKKGEKTSLMQTHWKLNNAK